MGIFDFVKSVGAKIGIGSEEEAPSADDLKKEIAKHGLEADDLDIKVEGDTVKVAGAAASKEVKEKIVLAVGNSLGVSKVEEKIDVAAAGGGGVEDDSTFYTVQKGDTLWKIADQHYGNGSQYNSIFEANKPMLSHPDKIYPGQVLRIPTATA